MRPLKKEEKVETIKQLVQLLKGCMNQTERIAQRYRATAHFQPCGWNSDVYYALDRVAQKSVIEHIGSERNIEELWEVIYFLDSANYKSEAELITKYITLAATPFDLWRIFFYCDCFHAHSTVVRFTPALEILDRLLTFAGDNRSARLNILATLYGSHSMSYQDYVYSRIAPKVNREE